MKKSILVLAVLAVLTVSFSSCSITSTSNGFHIGRMMRSEGGGCGAWHPAGGFRRR